MKRELIYVELKSGYNDNGPAWIGFAGSSKSELTVYFDGKSFKSLKGASFDGNYYELESGDEYWISGVKKNGQDRHWAGSGKIEIDEGAIGPYLALMGFSDLPRNIVSTKLAPSEFNQEHHEIENGVLIRGEDPEMVGDPRDSRFYALKKKDPSQLSVIEIRELMMSCDKMIEITPDKKARRSWIRYRARLSENLE